MNERTDLNPSPSTGLRRFLLAIFLFGATGISVELALMEHVEGVWQQLPLWMLGAGVLAAVLLEIRPNRRVLLGFRVLMVLVLLCGGLGVFLHYDGKAEFKLELDPTLSGWKLVWECLHGHSLPPVLAPGVLFLPGLLGFAWAHRYPISNTPPVQPSNP